MPDPKEDDYVF